MVIVRGIIMSKITFKELEKEYNSLWQKGKFQEVLEKVKTAAEQFPKEEYTTNLDLAVVYLQLGELDKTREILEDSLSKKRIYPKAYFGKLKDNEEFTDIFILWDKLIEEMQKESKSQYLLFTPNDFSKDKSYSLFIALHGWGEDAKFFSEFWKSKYLKENYILALPQSSQVVGSCNYSWDNEELAYKEIKEIYDEIKANYLINDDEIVVGGFSQGATLAMDLALNQDYIPVKGFISLCPEKPRNFTGERINEAKAKGIKGCIITGDQDSCYPQQQEMANKFYEIGFNYRIIVEKGLFIIPLFFQLV